MYTVEEQDRLHLLEQAYLNARKAAWDKEQPFPDNSWEFDSAWNRICEAEAPFRKKLLEYENYLEVKYEQT